MAASGVYALAVEVKDGPKLLISKLKSFDKSSMLVDIFTSLDISCGSGREIALVEASERPSGPWIEVELHESVSTLEAFLMPERSFADVKAPNKIPQGVFFCTESHIVFLHADVFEADVGLQTIKY